MQSSNYRVSFWTILCCGGLALSHASQAIDNELYQKYQSYKSRQQSTQIDELEQARSALRNGNLEAAQSHLDIARNLAYTPEAVTALERQITDEKNHREQLAQEKRQREEQERLAQVEQERLAQVEKNHREQLAQEKRQREEQERLAQVEKDRRASLASASSSSTSSKKVSASDLDYALNWGYDTISVHIPPVYETQLKERGLFFKEYYFETTESKSAQTDTYYQNVYFAVRLKNPRDRAVRVTYRIKAREKFSVERGVTNLAATGFWALAGATIAAQLMGNDNYNSNVAAGAAVLGAGYALSRQQTQNSSFSKEKTFTVTLKAGEQTYETGKFPISSTLSENPSLEIVSVE